MRAIAFFNNKGGVGKTTLLCNVAAYISQELGKRVCVVDCDPQCNASQYLFNDDFLGEIIDDKNSNIEALFAGLIAGEGHADNIPIQRSAAFSVDVVCGSPGLSLAEDFLAEEWASLNTQRGLSSTLVFYRALRKMENYDYVLFDVSPSLGAINRTVLLSCNYFVSPMSIDIFSLKAFKNISDWMSRWRSHWDYSVNSPQLDAKSSIVAGAKAISGADFIGYVSQQYIAKRDASGERRPVRSYDEILRQVDAQIEENFVDLARPPKPFEIGKIPNLHSLAPMSQSSRKPIFSLTGQDGVVGAHFQKVRDAKLIFAEVASEILERAR